MCFKLTDLKLPSWKKKFPSLYQYLWIMLVLSCFSHVTL